MKTTGAIVSDDRPWQKKSQQIKDKLLADQQNHGKDGEKGDESPASRGASPTPADVNVGAVLAELAGMVMLDSRDDASLLVSDDRDSRTDHATRNSSKAKTVSINGKKGPDGVELQVSSVGTSRLDDDISVEWAEIVGKSPTKKVERYPTPPPSTSENDEENDKGAKKDKTIKLFGRRKVEKVNVEQETEPKRKSLTKQLSAKLTKVIPTKSSKKEDPVEGKDPEVKKRLMPEIKMPEIKMPEMKMPEMKVPKMLKREHNEKKKEVSFKEEEDTTQSTVGYSEAVRERLQKVREVGSGMKKKASAAGSKARKLFSCRKQEEEIELKSPLPKPMTRIFDFEKVNPISVNRRPMAVKIHARPKRRASEVQMMREARKRVVVHTAWIRKLMAALEDSLKENNKDDATQPDRVWVHTLLDALVNLEKRIDADIFEQIEVDFESPKRMYSVQQMKDTLEEEQRVYQVDTDGEKFAPSGWIKRLTVALEQEKQRLEGKPVKRSAQGEEKSQTTWVRKMVRDDEKSQTTWVKKMVNVLEAEEDRIEQGLSTELGDESLLLTAWVRRMASFLEEEERLIKANSQCQEESNSTPLVAAWIAQMAKALQEEEKKIATTPSKSNAVDDVQPVTTWLENLLDTMEKDEKREFAEQARIAISKSRSQWMVEVLEFMEDADLQLGVVAAKRHWVWIKNLVEGIDEEEIVTKEMLPAIHEPLTEDDKTTLSFPISLVTPSVLQHSSSLVIATHGVSKPTKEMLQNIHQPVPQGDDHTTISFHSSFVSPTIVKRSNKAVIVPPKATSHDEQEANGSNWLLDQFANICEYRWGAPGSDGLDAGTMSVAESNAEYMDSVATSNTENTETN